MKTLQKQIKALLLESVVIDTEDEMISIINTTLPKIHIEEKKGQIKKSWGGITMPFDYGDMPEFINPADNMGWDIIIAPDSHWNQPGLKVAGILRYKSGKNKKGNDKIILAFNGRTTDRDKKVFKEFCKTQKKWFKEAEFFDTDSEDKLDEDASTTNPGWEGSTFKQYKLTRVTDDDYVGMGVGQVARQTFNGTWNKEEERRK